MKLYTAKKNTERLKIIHSGESLAEIEKSEAKVEASHNIQGLSKLNSNNRL